MIDDKKVLNSKCEGFVKELKTIDDKYQRKIKHLNDSHKVETKKVCFITKTLLIFQFYCSTMRSLKPFY